jgi:hypothetical protein
VAEYLLPSDLSLIVNALVKSTARAISDGSFKSKFGTSAFTIVDDIQGSILGLNVVPGHPDDQSAYRSELAGLFGIVLVVNLLCSWADIMSDGIEVACDGLSALNKAFETWPLNPHAPQHDLLQVLRTLIAASPVKWTTCHVDGHQDNEPGAILDFWVLQNIQMDNLAKVYWMQHSSTAPIVYPITDEGFQVWLGNHKLASFPDSVFFDHIHGKHIFSWHVSHGRFPACYARPVDWEICSAALARLPLGRRRWVTKHTSDFCSVGSKMMKWKEQATSKCPRCGEHENARHVWLCQDPAVYFVWYLLMASFSAYLESLHTKNDIICLLDHSSSHQVAEF